MGYSEMNCPHCGKMNRESCNAYMYGSPIRVCKSCGQKYVNSRYTEPALQGFDTRTTNPDLYKKATPFFAAFMVLGIVWNRYTVTHLGYYTTYQILFIFLGAIGTIGCIAQLIRIKTGIAEESNRRYLAESEDRLKDPQYVSELIAFGYNVPEKYRPAEVTEGEEDG